MAMKKVRIDVTQRDIERAHAGLCPIERGAKRVLPDPWVGTNSLFLPGMEVSLPARAVKFVSNFDGGYPVKPFSFTVRVPEAYVR